MLISRSLYRTLKTGAELASWAGETNLTNTWLSRAEALKEAINTHCWDDGYGAFKDNATETTLHPQDANSMAVLFGVVDSERAATISDRLTENWSAIGAVSPELPENIVSFISSFEIQSHLVVQNATRALDLIRRSWGWYMNNPNGTESTVIEGYLMNGTFGYRSSRGYGYDASYTSHSHGWSSGPTSALTEYIVGLSVTSRLGRTWSLAPQFADLEFAEAGFVTSLGKFQASWKRAKSGGYSLSFVAPQGTTGTLGLPFVTPTRRPSITLNGKRVTKGLSYAGSVASFALANGGSHSITVN